ncbi:TetR/AcrR family transcriptional regulator [Pengzhenrongella frigida]|uniref:TetR/AcrR family transcriptional regulator n=1 Tax=Pengzhenrongella frigida TaxID=1259133 RepID=A0A4Q5MWL6_9MICO|nr:TetR/AcrR family transcriptional regulator [Cellulomonas sp. HLT2-17]RYV50092.1 TetR/AcrR family transcriptional regulator [Cellulomonas sp. HLT2-17]
MGRTPLFDRTTVVRSARDLFWVRGFEGTSIAQLESATGLHRSSLYHCFGSKRGLFDVALDDYLDTVIRPRLRVLRTEPAGADAVLRYLSSVRVAIESLPDDAARRGCLLVGCAAGLAGQDEAAREFVAAYWDEFTAALRQALTIAGDPRVGAGVVDQRARTIAAMSTSAMLLDRVDRVEQLAILAAAEALVRSWFSPVDEPGVTPA